MTLKSITCFLLLTFAFPLFGQSPALKTYKEHHFRFINETDSVPVYYKEYHYDEEGRLLKKQEYYYNLDAGSTLNKSINALFLSQDKILVEEILHYRINKEPQNELLKTKYLVYGKDEASSKYIWRQFIDKSSELVQEDTLSYDKNQNLIKNCIYDYRGNTSLYCDVYKYNNKNQKKRWRLYNHWTTVNARSKVSYRKSKRQDYRYFYNNKGQLVKVKGKRYSTKHLEKYSYDEQGRLASRIQTEKRKSKNSKKKRKETGKKFTRTEDKIVQEYKNGVLVLEQVSQNETELKKTVVTLERDSLPKAYDNYQKGVLQLHIDYIYDEQGKLHIKNATTYDSKGLQRIVIQTDYDEQERPIKESNLNSGNTLSYHSIKYNEQGDKILQTMFLKNDKKFEKTLYFYEYQE